MVYQDPAKLWLPSLRAVIATNGPAACHFAARYSPGTEPLRCHVITMSPAK